MLHAKFPDHSTISSVVEDFLRFLLLYELGGHLGHVTWTIYINFFCHLPRRLHITFCFDWLSGCFIDEDL